MQASLVDLVTATRQASRTIARLDSSAKNRALLAMARRLIDRQAEILHANEQDLRQAEAKGVSAAMLDRLTLDSDRLKTMSVALEELVQLADPVGVTTESWIRPNGLRVCRMQIPLGVIAIIYEARPNVTSDAAGLCIKSGNAVILRGGSEALRSNLAVVAALRQGLEESDLPAAAVTLMPSTDRQDMAVLLKMDSLIDLVIPRGGEGLIRFVAENSRIPVIKHYKGICHLYVDKDADLDMALRLLVDGKTSRPGVCNALETLLVHAEAAAAFLPRAHEILKRKNVELRGCPRTCELIPGALPAQEKDYDTEHLDLILSVRVVKDVNAAVAHIEQHGSDHTEVIVTENLTTARHFVQQVNSSSVMVNASSRFADGGELGLGAEIGISTTRLHAYGPMGLEALTTKKFVVLGAGQTRHPV
ncbi:MAG TPA: glutamate-5-semialdehyde dehydrogenase [bacterium]|nr:glutamate-5-semialdehyde dehydrogenase [bacterium]